MRGLAVDGAQTQRRFLPGTMPIRLGLALSWSVLMWVKAQDLMATVFWQLFWAFFPFLFLFLLGGFIVTKLGLGGCLAAPFALTAFGRRAATPQVGWDVVVDTGPTGPETVAIAGDPPLQTDQELLVHGPRIGGIRHAWLIQGIAPVTFTRFGRGLIGTAILVAILLPQIVWLLVR